MSYSSTDFNDDLKKASIIFLSHFLIIFIFAILSAVDSFMYLDLYIPNSIYYSFDLSVMILTIIFNIIGMSLLIGALFIFKRIELNQTGDDKHYSRTIKYYPLVIVNYLLIEFGIFILLSIFFVVLAILAFVGTIYYILYLYNLGKESDSSLLKIGAIFFILGPIISEIAIFSSIFFPIYTLSALYTLIGVYFFLDILSGLSSILLGIGFILWQQRSDVGYTEPSSGEIQYSPWRSQLNAIDQPTSSRTNSIDNTRTTSITPSENSRMPLGDEIKCQTCGRTTSKDNSFCPYCGKYLRD